VLSQGACQVTNATFNWIRCHFDSNNKPTTGPIYLTQITSHGVSIVSPHPPGISIATVRHGTPFEPLLNVQSQGMLTVGLLLFAVPSITNTLQEYSNRALSSILITGKYFSPNIEDNRVILSSSHCNVTGVQVAVDDSAILTCAVDGTAFLPGNLTAKVIVQDGVSTPDVVIYKFSAQFGKRTLIIEH